MNTSSSNAATTAAPHDSVPSVSFTQALWFWLKLGFISFGGPAGQIAIMQRELVERRRWISQQRFMHALGYCMVLPGPEAQQLATYLGWLMHKSWGGIVAGALFVLPSLLILIGLSWVYLRFGSVPAVAGLLWGAKCAVVALVLHAIWRLGGKTLGHPLQRPLPWLLALGSFAAVALAQVGFPWLVLLAAVIGWLAARWAPGQFATPVGGAHASKGAKLGPAFIDDHSPPPAHARFSQGKLAVVLISGLALWAAPLGLLVWWQGTNGTLAQMAWFFTKAALLTFGGAYAVLPYVMQGAVVQHQWLSSAQMMDGLALGETTPGPLIMVVAFVGFLGGWSHQVLGPQALFAGAALAAAVVTWFTFLPSFVFILAGGPLVEASHNKPGFAAPLAAVSAAVVGVMATLAWSFLVHIAYPNSQASLWTTLTTSAPDWRALVLAALALYLLAVRGWSAVSAIVLCAASAWGLQVAGVL